MLSKAYLPLALEVNVRWVGKTLPRLFQTRRDAYKYVATRPDMRCRENVCGGDIDLHPRGVILHPPPLLLPGLDICIIYMNITSYCRNSLF